ncbi:MAG: hypothetical protein HY078_05070 [Elusimicrobia bacterium]|nr:hypothetical protein [Elusimicrobiota bacterium]
MATRKRTADRAGGTYVYDKALGKVVKVSNDVPKVASKSKSRAPESGPCGRSACGGGRCAGG